MLLGVAAAFAVQSAIAVTAGGLLHLLPERVVEAVVAGLFALGAVLLIRESFEDGHDHADHRDDIALGATPGSDPDAGRSDPVGVPRAGATTARRVTPFAKVALTAFGVLFAAEWGDASQIATAGLAARLNAPIAVGLGAWAALTAIACLAALVGKLVLRRMPVRIVHRVAGALFAAFAIAAAVSVAI